MSNRLDQDREARLQPVRMDSCQKKLEDLGYTVARVDDTRLDFKFNGNTIQFYPYSGWFTGKGVGSGRGFNYLLRKLNDESI